MASSAKLAGVEQAIARSAAKKDPVVARAELEPSTDAWRTFTRLAGQISPRWALTQVNEISDAEMKVLAETALAQAWLDVSRGTTIVMSSRKGNQSMNISRESPE